MRKKELNYYNIFTPCVTDAHSGEVNYYLWMFLIQNVYCPMQSHRVSLDNHEQDCSTIQLDSAAAVAVYVSSLIMHDVGNFANTTSPSEPFTSVSHYTTVLLVK